VSEISPEAPNALDEAVFTGSVGEELVGAIGAVDQFPEEPGSEGLRKRRIGWGFWLAVAWIAFIVIVAVLAPVLPLPDPDLPGYGPPLESPGGEYALGTDFIGRDLLSRTIWGARVSLAVAFTSIAFGLVVGGSLGIVGGYYRGRVDAVAVWIMDVLLAFPAILLAVALVTFLGSEFQNVLLAIGIISIAPIARLARANTLTWSEREFVQAARTLGAKNTRIMWREILPNVVIPMSALALLGVAVAIVAEGALAFLGLSVEESGVLGTDVTWGKMINEGKDVLSTAPFVAFVPAGAMFLTVLALNLAGDRLRDYFDVREGAL
jgi:peptide/nickel transport system permease protein